MRIHLLLVFNSFISVSIWVQVFHNVSGQSRFELAVTMSRRKEAIEELRRSMPGPSCKPVRTILDPRGGNAISIKDIRARYATSAYVQHQRPQYSLPPRCLSPYSSYFLNEMFEGAILGYLFNVYCRKLILLLI